ncbi:Werner syndrome ATP-dependent helicase-like protein [Hordeum vulgare]|nr:Werner Syndrome-like exonuclease [Hordeum vulgare subsp. vulgare]KAE8820753.1 Werner syndrome ATP-dependent helicase-like protein [Hordeum vulgare]
MARQPHKDAPYYFDTQGIDIKATVTVRASTVEEWISRVWTTYLRDADDKKLVGLDTEFTDSVFGKKQKDLPNEQKQRAAVLQLCVANECLVYHIVHARHIPAMLRRFLADGDIVFCGAGIKQDQEMLAYYGLEIASAMDLQRDVDVPVSVCGKVTPSLIDLANYFLGTRFSKDGECARLRRSGWGAFPLSLERIRYAAVDARLSFEVVRQHFRSRCYDRPGDRFNLA